MIERSPACRRRRAELDALVTGVDAAGDVPRDLWVEMSDEARAAMDPTELTEHADAAQTLRALLAGFDGIWYVPADGLSTAEPLWGSDGGPDGTLTAFEARVGHDLVRPVLERLALRPGTEQRRLALVGNAVLRSASVLRAFHRHPDVAEGDLDVTIQRDLAIVHLQVTALRLGLLDLLFPGERPVAAAALVRACLGAVAVDAGPEHAVGLATQWLDAVRVGGDDLDHVALISCQVQPDGVQVELITPDRELTWTLADAEAPRTAIAIQGISAALDSLPTSHDGHGLILEAPSRVVGALERTDGKVPPPLGTAVERFLARVRARDLRMVLTVPGDHPSDATAHRR